MAKKPAAAPKVYVDTDVYVCLLSEDTTQHPDLHHPKCDVALEVFQAAERGDIVLAASALTQAELGCNHAAQQENERAQRLLDGWFTAKSTEWIEIDRHLAREAARLSPVWKHRNAVAGKKMNAADFLHLAAAVTLGCDHLMTYDGGYPIGHTVEGVAVMRPDVVWQPGLWEAAAGE